MAECIYFSGANNNCSKYSANKISKNRVLFLMFLFCVFFFGNAKVFSQVQPPGTGAWNAPYQISTMQHWIWFANNGFNQTAPNDHFELANDIGTPANPVTQMVSGVFTGLFNGKGNRITVNLDYTNSNAPNVGLFSQISGGFRCIDSLTIDGYVVGGASSENVGGLVGLITSGSVLFVNNLADVTGLASNSSVGGIAGRIVSNDWLAFSVLVNNGSVTGGRYVAGIVGFANYPSGQYPMTIRCSQNAGEIRSNNANNVEFHTYMAGIVAYVSGHYVNLHDLVNIGKVFSHNANFAGGIIAYLEVGGGNLYSFSNSGIVDGAKNYVGGVFGYINVSNGVVQGCINTNWIEPTNNGLNSGAIAGFNAGSTLIACFYDEQMCVLPGIGNNIGNATPLPTMQMLGNSLQPLLDLGLGLWIYRNNLYPSPVNASPPNNPDHPIALLSAAPIYLAGGEKLNNVTQNFNVSNRNTVPPFAPQTQLIPFPYEWGSFTNLPAGGWIHIPNSEMLYIDIPFSPSNNAIINGSGSGWDTLKVRLTQSYYMNLYPLNYNVIFEKQIPIFIK